MKPFCVIILMCSSLGTYAQAVSEVIDTKRHKIIIQFNDNDSLSQIRLVSQLQNIRTSWPNASIEVVCLGEGLDLITTSNSKAVKEVTDWMVKGSVIFAACNYTMRNRNIRRADLLPQVKVVPSAAIELTFKQEQGWSYYWGPE